MEKCLLESPSGKTVFVLKVGSHDASLESKNPQDPSELYIILIETWNGKIIGLRDVMQELKAIVEQYEVPQLGGMPMLSYPKSLQKRMEESQQRFGKGIMGSKRKFTDIKQEDDSECLKKIKSNAYCMFLNEKEASDDKCDEDVIKNWRLNWKKKREENRERKYRCCESCMVKIGSEGICER
ncbi:hypothetical protein BPOR_0047g00080 [Botrytis porri]|uniref:Uncharacterized protein n=1 Tax=Botrytis porri TaxID=87229 RepID=A0A4Z1L272_9HELO|nr:hypothetical protein BPOR_0047g00080 [Botrytis porri]